MTTWSAGTALPGYITRAKNIHAKQGRGTEHNIHDDAAAQKMGFQRGFVAGGQSLAWVTQMLVDAFGQAYFESGRIDLSFKAPVYDDEDIQIAGQVRELVPEDGGTRVECDVWVEKDGNRAVVGTASARV